MPRGRTTATMLRAAIANPAHGRTIPSKVGPRVSSSSTATAAGNPQQTRRNAMKARARGRKRNQIEGEGELNDHPTRRAPLGVLRELCRSTQSQVR